MARTPHRALALATAGVLILAGCGDDDASSGSGDGVAIEDAWARSSPMVASAAAAYMTLSSEEGDTLVGVSVDPAVAATAEIHETVAAAGGDTTMAGDMGSDTTMAGGTTEEMGMRPIDELALPAGEDVVLEPGGYHLMLLDLAEPLEAGQTVTLTLELEKAGSQEIDVPVREEAP